MGRERKVLLIAFAVAILIAAAFVLAPRVGEELAPSLQRAWVAIEPAGSPVARTGRIELPAGTPFTLHAVLEAVDRHGKPLYYTEAVGLEVDGEPVPQSALRPWDRTEEVQVLWFTVEGDKPFLPLEDAADLSRLSFSELFRADWPKTWSVPGVLEPRNDDHLRRVVDQKERPFGTQRFHARVEIFERDRRSVPRERFSSWGAAELRERLREFPTVVATLPGAAAPASGVFGLTQISPPEGASRELLASIAELAGQGLAFSVATVLRETLREAGHEGSEGLPWREVALAGSGLRWDADVGTGDLLRSGAIVAVLYRDAGTPGALDPDDLVLAYDRGAAVLPLSAVFTTGLPVEWAPLAER